MKDKSKKKTFLDSKKYKSGKTITLNNDTNKSFDRYELVFECNKEILEKSKK